MDKNEAKKVSSELIEQAEACYLTSIDESGYPQTRAMLNLRNREKYPSLIDFFKNEKDEFTTLFTTNTSSKKISQLSKNNHVSVYYCLPSQWKGVMLQGDIEIVTDTGIKHAFWQKDWTMYYPGGWDDPDYALLRLIPKYAKCYLQFNILELIDQVENR